MGCAYAARCLMDRKRLVSKRQNSQLLSLSIDHWFSLSVECAAW